MPFSQKNPSTENGCGNGECEQANDECDSASVMNVISGVKPSVYDSTICQKSDTLPKMGVHISPDLELKLEKVLLGFCVLIYFEDIKNYILVWYQYILIFIFFLGFFFQMLNSIDHWGVDIFSLGSLTNNRPLTTVTYKIFQVANVAVLSMKPVFVN